MAEELSSDEFKMLLLMSGENPDYQSWEGFARLIRGAINMNARVGYTKEFEEVYEALLEAEKMPELMKAMWSHQLDNYIFGSIAAFLLKIPSVVPLIAWAAQNKQLYPGLRGECVNLRFLILAGYDVNQPDPESGNTALHCKCGLKWGPGVHLQAIQYLLDNGADCNIKNKNGDTPVTYLAGAYPWSDYVHNVFGLLLEHGGDPTIAANDGKTALDLLKQNQRDHDKSANRLSAIEFIELSGEAPKARPTSQTQRL